MLTWYIVFYYIDRGRKTILDKINGKAKCFQGAPPPVRRSFIGEILASDTLPRLLRRAWPRMRFLRRTLSIGSGFPGRPPLQFGTRPNRYSLFERPRAAVLSV